MQNLYFFFVLQAKIHVLIFLEIGAFVYVFEVIAA